MSDKALRVKYTPFPRLPPKARRRGEDAVDVAKVKAMYIEQTCFRWADFCKRNNFNPNSTTSSWWKAHVDWEQWKKDWIRHRGILTEEEMVPEMINVTGMVARERIRYVNDWTRIAGNMKALLGHLLDEHIQNAGEDQKNALAIQAGRAPKKLKLGVEEMTEFATAAQKIQDLQAKALMIIPGETKIKTDDDSGDPAEHKIPEFEIHPMGDVMSGPERTRLLASYFDQFQEKKEEPKKVEPEVVDAAADQG